MIKLVHSPTSFNKLLCLAGWRMSSTYLAAIDQGTTSTRFIVFDRHGVPIEKHQIHLNQIYSNPGWVEHDPWELVDSVVNCMDETAKKLDATMGAANWAVKGIGLTNQRETTVCWDAETGKPLYNAIVWNDTRTKEAAKKFSELSGGGIGCYKNICGLPINAYFSALKIRWLLDNVPAVSEAAQKRRLKVGTVDSWLLYNLIGNVHITDVTNASRTMLMNIHTLQWDTQLCSFFGIEKEVLPDIRSSAEVYGVLTGGVFKGVPISGCLGDQQAAFLGHQCFNYGDVKNTYGTGCFLLFNTGNTPITSTPGILSTVAFKLGPNAPPLYALEGAIADAGSTICWLRDNLNLIGNVDEVDEMASQVQDTGGVFFITAFSGLYAPYWRDNATGSILGLTHFTRKEHIVRAALEAVGYHTRTVLEVVESALKIPSIKRLKVDGGLTNSDSCMQLQADILGIPIERQVMHEMTALGAAFAAGIGIDVYKGLEDLTLLCKPKLNVFLPRTESKERNHGFQLWREALQKTLGLSESEML